MRTFAIVGDPPAFDLVASVVERKEDVLVETIETFFPQPRIETLDLSVLDRLARRDKLEFYPMLIRPLIEDPAAELRPTIRLNH